MKIEKINELKQWMETQHVDFVYISDPNHIAYFSGYKSNPHERVLALFIPLAKDPFLFTPALETEDAESSPWAYPVYGYLDNENPWEKICSLLSKTTIPKKIAIEKDSLSVARFERLQHYLSMTDFSVNATPIIEKIQLIKTSYEKQLLFEAGSWADIALEIGFKAIKDGVTEQEIVAEIEYQLKRQGIQQMSFNTLVLAGKNTASPHGTPGKNVVLPKELVLFDLGVIWENYCSDVTRTVVYKEPTQIQEEVYNIVLHAQQSTIEAVRPGITAGELDAIARNIITDAGYGEYFTHRLGHGIGTTVHEYPSLITGNDLVIQEGMCFSIEPGIYIPEKVGVRIEDCVFVTKSGCHTVTQTPKILTIID